MSEPDYKFIDKVPADKRTQLFKLVQLYLKECSLIIADPHSKAISKSLSYADKVAVSKLVKLISQLCKLPKRQLLESIAQLERKDSLKDIIGELYFNRGINNYQLIKLHFSGQPIPDDYGTRVVNRTDDPTICVKFEYRIEVTLSSQKAKKVLRPLILMIFTMQDDSVRSFYVDVAQFQEIRKHVALGLRNLHQIESKG